MTPPSRARSGETWPGRARSDGFVDGSMAARTVAARSAAEIPVPPRLASIGTQNAVPKTVVFEFTANGISSSSRRLPVIDRQICPRPCFAMKLMTSAVTFSAAIVRSPSFSRSSSSQTMIMCPSRIAAIASSMGANGVRLRAPLAMRIDLVMFSFTGQPGLHARRNQRALLRQLDCARHILADHAEFEVDPIANLKGRQRCVRPGKGNDHDVEHIATQTGDREAYPVNGDRAFADHVRRQAPIERDCQPVRIAFST